MRLQQFLRFWTRPSLIRFVRHYTYIPRGTKLMTMLNPGGERHTGFLLAIFFCVKHGILGDRGERGTTRLLVPVSRLLTRSRLREDGVLATSLRCSFACFLANMAAIDFHLHVCPRHLSTACWLLVLL